MSTSCTPKEPFIKLNETGEASILNYNLPQSTCYKATVKIALDFPNSYFNPPSLPVGGFWDLATNLTKEEWIEKLKDEVSFASDTSIFSNPNLIRKYGVHKLETKIIEEQVVNGSSSLAEVVKEPEIAGVPISEIADKIKKGFKPLLKQNIAGDVVLSYASKVDNPEPQIVLLLNLKVCSYLGDYGAGRTLKTFSLLPGERTTISVRTWEHNEETKREASNVLDSLSESSAEELQTILETETSHTKSNSHTIGEEIGGNMNISVPLKKVNIGAGGGATESQTFTTAFENSVSQLESAIDTQSSKSDSLRQVEVNTETSSTSISETEQTTVRELENINKSRVLNFVFRQLLQEYFTITYLDNVQVAYVTGHGELNRVVDLGGIEGLLQEVIPDGAKRDTALAKILNRLCNITDYTGTKQRFIDCIEENLTSDLTCSCLPSIPAETTCYFAKRKDLSQSYNGKTVNGVIMGTKHRVLRTSAVVVDALLGQGEALDCYNQKLQDAAVVNAELNNDKLQQAIDTINAITDPVERANLYKKVFTDCCDTPQSGCGCNDNTPIT